MFHVLSCGPGHRPVPARDLNFKNGETVKYSFERPSQTEEAETEN